MLCLQVHPQTIHTPGQNEAVVRMKLRPVRGRACVVLGPCFAEEW